MISLSPRTPSAVRRARACPSPRSDLRIMISFSIFPHSFPYRRARACPSPRPYLPIFLPFTVGRGAFLRLALATLRPKHTILSKEFSLPVLRHVPIQKKTAACLHDTRRFGKINRPRRYGAFTDLIWVQPSFHFVGLARCETLTHPRSVQRSPHQNDTVPTYQRRR